MEDFPAVIRTSRASPPEGLWGRYIRVVMENIRLQGRILEQEAELKRLRRLQAVVNRARGVFLEAQEVDAELRGVLRETVAVDPGSDYQVQWGRRE